MRSAKRGKRRSPAGAPIRVALLAPSFHTGGAERQMMLLAAALPKASFDLRLLAMSERGELASEAEALGIPVHVLGLRREDFGRSSIRSARQLVDSVREYRRLTADVDIVDAWLVPAYTFAGTIQPLARVPVVLAGRRSSLDVHRTRTRYREMAGAMAMRGIRAVVANSQAAADEAIAAEGIAGSRVHVIRNAVVPMPVPPGARDALRSDWGLTPQDVVVGCVGTYKHGKGQPLLLDVAERLRSTHSNVRVRLVGDGELRDWLASEIERRDLGGIVTLHTGVRDARTLYVGFDIVVQASDSEGLPNVVLEAAAAGRAIVATAVGGTAEIITSDTDGMLVARGDADGLAASISRLVSDPDLRATLGTAAAARALAFSPARLAEQTGALYQDLLSGRA